MAGKTREQRLIEVYPRRNEGNRKQARRGSSGPWQFIAPQPAQAPVRWLTSSRSLAQRLPLAERSRRMARIKAIEGRSAPGRAHNTSCQRDSLGYSRQSSSSTPLERNPAARRTVSVIWGPGLLGTVASPSSICPALGWASVGRSSTFD